MIFSSLKINIEFPVQFGTYHIQIWGKPENYTGKEVEFNMNNFDIIEKQCAELKNYYLENLDLNLVTLNQVHGNTVINLENLNSPILDGDAFFTRNKSNALAIKTADCVPIMFFNPDSVFFGSIHAGWRGLKLEILDSSLSQIKQNFNENHLNINFIIGPHISCQNYETSEDVFSQFDLEFSHCITGSDKRNLDLANMIKHQLTKSTLNQVMYLNHNTFKSHDFFSHRAGDKPRNFNVIYFKSIA